jgi:putative PEP-CTERM system TPR-repeat lipoprotein
MNHRISRAVTCAIALVSLVALAGCGSKDASSYVASAKKYLTNADYKAAIIQAKNALQAEPRNAAARLVLAEALLRGGDAPGAEAEARKAIDGGAPADEAYPLLARALVAQGAYAKVMSELADRKFESPHARADVAVALASARAAQGDRAGAKARLQEALAAEPGHVGALLFEAQLAAQAGDLAAARNRIDEALAKNPKSLEALLTKADLELAERHVDEGQKLMQQAVDAHPDAVAPHAALAALAVRTNQRELAKDQVAKMKKIAPGDLRTLYSDAFVSYTAGDYGHTRDVTQKILSVWPTYLPAVMLSGLADMHFGSLASADEKLRRVIQREPTDMTARRALATIALQSGQPQQALDVIRPALARTPDDPILLRLAGEAYLASGNAMEAESAYERANAIDKGNMASAVRLAQVRFAAGDSTRAMSELEALSQGDASSTQPDLALFAAHLKRREFDKALAVVDDIEKKQPKSPRVPQLRGVVFLAKRDLANARLNFEKALSLQPDYAAAAASLATIDIQEGKPLAARDRYDALLKKNPDNEQLLVADAQLLELAGAPPDQIRGVLDRAVSAHPSSVPARIARVSFEIRHQDAKAALTAAQSAATAIPNTPQLVELLANTQLMNGNVNQAIETLKQVAALQPKNPLVLVRLAELQTSIKDYSSALANEQKALSMEPGLSAAWVGTAKTYLASGKPDEALAQAHKLQKEHPDKSFGYVLEGEILATQRKLPDAAAAFQKALAREPTAAVATRTYSVLQAAGMGAEADKLMAKWNKEHPNDVTMLQLAAEQDQARKQYASALEGYKKVLEVNPDSVAALNNTAWVLIEQGKPEALEYAERAHRLAPFNSNVLDTLGWAAASTGDPQRAVKLLRMASALAPGNAEIRLHLGKALLDSGDKPAARQTLTELSKLSKDSPLRSEAEKLLATM